MSSVHSWATPWEPRRWQRCACRSSVPVLRDPHRFDADPDPAYPFDADLDADPDPACHFDAGPDPYPTFHCISGAYFQIKAQNLEKWLKLGSYSLHFGLSSENWCRPGSGSSLSLWCRCGSGSSWPLWCWCRSGSYLSIWRGSLRIRRSTTLVCTPLGYSLGAKKVLEGRLYSVHSRTNFGTGEQRKVKLMALHHEVEKNRSRLLSFETCCRRGGASGEIPAPSPPLYFPADPWIVHLNTTYPLFSSCASRVYSNGPTLAAASF